MFHFTRTGCVFCGAACRGFNFAHELLCTTRVRQLKDLRRNKSILIILPRVKKHILQGLSRRSDSLIHLHGLPCMATLYSTG